MIKTLTNSKKLLGFLVAIVFLTSFTSCEIIGDIFEAGIWTGIILIVLIVAILIYIFSKFRGRD